MARDAAIEADVCSFLAQVAGSLYSVGDGCCFFGTYGEARRRETPVRWIERRRGCFRPGCRDWLPEDHPARFVVEIVDRLALGRLTSACGHGGKRAYHPGMLLALLFYGYATGVVSSRKLEQADWDSVAFRYIAANSHPDHDTIAAFRMPFVDELENLFVQILTMARSMGLPKLGTVSLDGTKVQANASRHKALSWEYANRFETKSQAEVEQPVAMAEAADAEAAAEVDVPAELKRRDDRLVTIHAAKAEMEVRAAMPAMRGKRISARGRWRRARPGRSRPAAGAATSRDLARRIR